MKKEVKLRQLIREEVRNLLFEERFEGSSGSELRVKSRDYDPRTGKSGVMISVNGSRPVMLNDEQAHEVIQTIKLAIKKD